MKIITLLLSYLIGSISFAYIIGKIIYKVDIREHGSGNLGGTNAGRILGSRVGLSVILLDIFKGMVVLLLAKYLVPNDTLFHITAALFGVIGHLLPIYYGFKGGKAVAITVGILIIYNPLILLYTAILYFALQAITGIKSLSALIGYMFLFVLIITLNNIYLSIFAFLVLIMIFIRHKKNIIMIINGTEKKTNFLDQFSKYFKT